MIPFKIRCSAIGEIMTEPRKKGDALSKTAESYLDRWIKEQVYGRKYQFTSKYTDKGIIMEDNAIDFIAEMLGFGFLIKNETFFENEYLRGTPDILPKGHDLVIDVKNSWSWESFPLLETEVPNKDYYWQLQGYMALTGLNHAKLIYVLSDTPDHLIEREARRWCYSNGYDELENEIYERFYGEMTYPDVKRELRIKVFDIERNDEAITSIYEKVMNCRDYINERIKNIPTWKLQEPSKN